MRTLSLTLFALYIMLTLSPAMAGSTVPTVFVSILPQRFFVQQIGMDRVDVGVMVKPGASPATYEPKASQMRKLSSASAYFAIGVPFEQTWLDRIAGVNPEMTIVHTDTGITKLAMAEHLHDEDPGGGHGSEPVDDSGLDPHIWLSPTLVKKQAATITAALSELFPGDRNFFQQNLETFLGRIDELNGRLHHTLQDEEGLEFMVFHPSWGYFAQEYGLHQIAIEIEGKSPKPAQLRELIDYSREHDIRVIFAQPQFSAKSAQAIAREIDGAVVMIDPLAEDWLTNMQDVVDTFQRTLR